MNRILLLLFIAWLLLNGCTRNRSKVNISRIHLEIEILRFEQDLFNIDLMRISNEIPELEEKYGDFFTLFNHVINIGQPDLSAYPEYLKAFITDPVNNKVYDKTMEIGKVVINPDGTYEATANNDERDPKLSGEFFISDVWDDSDGNIWYEINVESAELSSNHYMIKIGYGGTTLTILQSDNYDPEDIDPENKKDEVIIYYAL